MRRAACRDATRTRLKANADAAGRFNYAIFHRSRIEISLAKIFRISRPCNYGVASLAEAVLRRRVFKTSDTISSLPVLLGNCLWDEDAYTSSRAPG